MGYGQAPWEFKGQALYQLSLVKIEEVFDTTQFPFSPDLNDLNFTSLHPATFIFLNSS
jgi:hypothetical protein